MGLFKVVPKDSACRIQCPDGTFIPLDFSPEDLAKDIAACMDYAYFTGKQDGIREVAEEIRTALQPNIISIETGKARCEQKT